MTAEKTFPKSRVKPEDMVIDKAYLEGLLAEAVHSAVFAVINKGGGYA